MQPRPAPRLNIPWTAQSSCTGAVEPVTIRTKNVETGEFRSLYIYSSPTALCSRLQPPSCWPSPNTGGERSWARSGQLLNGDR